MHPAQSSRERPFRTSLRVPPLGRHPAYPQARAGLPRLRLRTKLRSRARLSDEKRPTLSAMHFPPPIRLTAPLLALFFGLVATWFDYRLNLDLDLARHLAEVRERVDANGRRLARLSEKLV